MIMTRYDSAAAEWAEELATRRGVESPPAEPPVGRDGRDALRARPPRPGRDAAGRVHPLVNCSPGLDLF